MAEKTNPEIVVDETPKKTIAFMMPTKTQLFTLLGATVLGAAAAGATVAIKLGNKKNDALEASDNFVESDALSPQED